jgi:membrane-bound inhibitor of C-type lysozyme
MKLLLSVIAGVVLLGGGYMLYQQFIAGNGADVFTGEPQTMFCDTGQEVSVRKANDEQQLELQVDGTTYVLERASATRGTRYTNGAGVSYLERIGETAVTVSTPNVLAALTCQPNREEMDESLPTNDGVTSPRATSSLIRVDEPAPGDVVGDPVLVSGEARGYWFFEATAPVVVTNWDGLIIGEGYITAEGDWMTEEFVPFAGTIEYELPADSYSATGTVIFKRANPSGLSENDDAVEVVVQLTAATVVETEVGTDEHDSATDDTFVACTSE